jgi:hypothetical protein
MPSTVSLYFDWKAFNAASVAGPKLPSTARPEPITLLRFVCRVRTALPDEPRRSVPSELGSGDALP